MELFVIRPTGYGTYGFRYSEFPELALCSLFAVGFDRVHDTGYRWDGMTRTDGPLLLFQYTLEGEGIFEHGDNVSRIGPGQAFLAEIPSDHRYYFPEDQRAWEFAFLLFRPRLVLPNWQEAVAKLGRTPALPIGSRPIRLLLHIYEEARAGRITDPYHSSSFVYQFVTGLCRYALHGRSEWPAKIRTAVSIIESRYASMLSLEQLADELRLSKYHFLRSFSSAVGMTPNEYVNRVRTERAMELLRQTDENVERIAQRVGYSSGSYFIKAFRRHTGLTPGAFRKGDPLVLNRLYFD
ncbi:helix-turn-helix domain-containing protein [Cohnella sp. CFH 77786]|uniref:helix-turn-helix transcriptional regulator n=1 Tax=Cohnella sp. CFH 77786 TaxID=2662265 RepID=UPI001C60806C|nr:AraC family transcriptional regulator [Cohnella sp. CFH 77786]MBW5445340.1 helix-turn-helix domain-containing protein [Cohnella sp. CFH 77786]